MYEPITEGFRTVRPIIVLQKCWVCNQDNLQNWGWPGRGDEMELIPEVYSICSCYANKVVDQWPSQTYQTGISQNYLQFFLTSCILLLGHQTDCEMSRSLRQKLYISQV